MKKHACAFVTYTIRREDVDRAEAIIIDMTRKAYDNWNNEDARWGILAARLRMIDMVREWKERFFMPHINFIQYGTSRPTEKLYLRYKMQGRA